MVGVIGVVADEVVIGVICIVGVPGGIAPVEIVVVGVVHVVL